jgi:hypothetical protein
MYGLVASILFISIFGFLAWQVVSRIKVPSTPPSSVVPAVSAAISANRYKPMLRLLSDEDLNFVGSNVALRKALRARRRELFRGYLRCLTRDYGRLLSGIRAAMARAGVDRPDLARALAKNRALFTIAVYKIEVRLALHALGVGTVDISGLVEAFEGLRSQVNVLSALPSAA